MGKVINISSYREELEKKKSIVLGVMVAYFKEIAETQGLQVPYFLQAQNLYEERIKSLKDLDEVYNMITEKD